MSKLTIVILGVLVSALALSPTAGAKTSKYCSLVSARQIGRPLHVSGLRASSVSAAYPSRTGAKGRITLCSYKSPKDMLAETGVGKFASAKGAKGEFAAIVHQEQRGGNGKKVHGPWDDAYDFGADGFIVLNGRYTWTIQYASGAPNYSNITSKVLAGLAKTAVRKLQAAGRR